MTFQFTRRTLNRTTAAGLTLGLGVAALLSGCGGASTSTKSFGTYTPNGPVVFGINAVGAFLGTPQYNETSGALALSGSNSGQAIAVAAVASTALPPSSEIDTSDPTVVSFNTIPLGFGPGARYIDGTTYGAAIHPGDTFIFGTYIANGLDQSGNFIPVSGVTVVSTDLSVASTALTYSPNYTGPLANAQYRSGTLTVPGGTTTGLKQLTATVSDSSPSTADHSPSSTTFDMVVLAGNDSAVLAQIVDAKGNLIPGAVATIDGADAPGYVGPGQTAASSATASVSDIHGMVVLFAPAGAHTVTVTSGSLTGTLSVTTKAGQISSQDASSKALTIPVPTPAAAASIRARK